MSKRPLTAFRPLLKVVMLCFALGSTPTLAIAASSEGLALELSGDWSVGFHKDEKTTSIMEFVHGKETVNSWTELITVQRFFLGAWGGQDPDEVYSGIQKQHEQVCPGTTTWNVIHRDPRRVVYEWSTSEVCAGWPPQNEIAAVVIGRTDRYRVAYTTTKTPIAAPVRDAWIRLLECLQISSKQNGPPVWGRPTAPPWVQQIMDSKSWSVEGYVLSGLPLAAGAVMSACKGMLEADIVDFSVEASAGTQKQAQTLEHAVYPSMTSLAQLRDPEVKAHKKACGKNWSTKTYAETSDRIVYEDVLRGCKGMADEFEVGAEFLMGGHVFTWTTYVQDGSLSDEALAALVESTLGIRLEQASPTR